jgi:Flp pilus assembly protein TadG
MRGGAIIVWCAFLLPVLLGMVGLVIDGGLLMAAHRHAHNAADAAAMAAAYEMMRGATNDAARATGTTYVTAADHNDLPGATVTINIPPSQGPYAGSDRYAEAIVASPIPTFFIHVLPGVNNGTTVNARAVAGYEFVAAGEGVIALNCGASPGLKVSGGGNLVVEGDIYVNSHGGGVDENGNPVTTGENQTAVTANNNSTVIAANVNVVGGVNNPDNFDNAVPGGENPLHANSSETPDPFATLESPCVSNGLVDVRRGAPVATNMNLQLNNPDDTSESPNYIDVDPVTLEETLVLHPGIYDEIKITGGRVLFVPGIYVLSPQQNTTWVLDITGGDVTAEGVMFYSAGSDFDPNACESGSHDVCEDEAEVTGDDQYYGGTKINAAMVFKPIDTATYSYSPPVDEQYNDMLFFQARDNASQMQIEGDSDEGNLSGTLYAKWAEVKIAGQGTYDFQFVVGSMDIVGQGDITLKYDGDDFGKAPRVFLVE